jgi:hypothetical protein
MKVDFLKCSYCTSRWAGDESYLWCDLENRECWASLGNDCDCFENDCDCIEEDEE